MNPIHLVPGGFRRVSPLADPINWATERDIETSGNTIHAHEGDFNPEFILGQISSVEGSGSLQLFSFPDTYLRDCYPFETERLDYPHQLLHRVLQCSHLSLEIGIGGVAPRITADVLD